MPAFGPPWPAMVRSWTWSDTTCAKVVGRKPEARAFGFWPPTLKLFSLQLRPVHKALLLRTLSEERKHVASSPRDMGMKMKTSHLSGDIDT